MLTPPCPAIPKSSTRSSAPPTAAPSSPFTRTFMSRHIPLAFITISALCASVGLATTTRLPGRVIARCTAFTAAIVDFPHCREQFKIPSLASDARNAHCFASGSIPSRSRANATTPFSAGKTTPPATPSPPSIGTSGQPDAPAPVAIQSGRAARGTASSAGETDRGQVVRLFLRRFSTTTPSTTTVKQSNPKKPPNP